MSYEVGISLEGYVKIYICENGNVIKEFPRQKNMILNQGKDGIMSGSYSFSNAFRYCAAGSGSTAVAATDVALVTELNRTGTYLTGSGNCGTTDSGASRTLRRTFEFSAESGSVNYRELGFAPNSTPTDNLFSRVLISGGTVSLVAGQNLRVVYDLKVTFSPNTTQSGSITVAGWPVSPASNTNATWALQAIGISSIDSGTGGGAGGNLFEPSTTGECECYTGNISISAFGNASTGGSAIPNSTISYTWGTYVPGTFTRSTSFSYATAASFSSTAIKAFRYTSLYNNALTIIFDQNQTKDNTHRLRYNGFTVTLT